MKKSKAILMALCAVLLVAASVMGTLAYLTSTDSVTNTFTVGNVAITMDELDVDDSTADANRDKANAYKLLPGHTFTKDPTIHVASTSEDCYLFVKVVNEIKDIEAADTETTKTIATQMAAKGWAPITEGSNVYAYIGTATGASVNAPVAVSGGTDHVIFENFTISGNVSNTDLADYDSKTIVVNAYAMQKDGFESKSASEIWATANFS